MIASPLQIKECKCCGSTNLSWQTTMSIHIGSAVQQGRLTTRDVECLFFLGCNDCSETLATMGADSVAKLMNDGELSA